MDQVLEDFIAALRAAGVRISTSESIDAYRVLGMIGYEKKEILPRCALGRPGQECGRKRTFSIPLRSFFLAGLRFPFCRRPEGEGVDRHGVHAPWRPCCSTTGETIFAAMLAEAAGRMESDRPSASDAKGRLRAAPSRDDGTSGMRRLIGNGSGRIVAAGGGAEAEALEQGMRHLKGERRKVYSETI